MTSTGDRRLAIAVSSIHFAQHVFRILPPVLPLLARSFPYPLWQLGALVSVYFAGSGFGQTPAGVLADRYDRRFVVPPGVALMGLGYLVVGLGPRLLAPDAAALVVAGRRFTAEYLLMAAGTFVSGLGASTVHPVGFPLVIANAATEAGGRALGVWNSAAKFGDAAAPLAVALLILVIDWDGVFLVFGLVGLVYAAWLYRLMSGDMIETRPGRHREGGDAPVDPPGRGGEGDHDPSHRDDGDNDEPATPDAADGEDPDDAPDRRRYAYPMAALFLFFVARAFSEKGLKAFLPTFITDEYGYAFTVAGVYVPPESFADLYFTAVFVVAALTTLVTGWLVDRYDPRTVLIAFFGVAALALAVLATGVLSPLALLAVLAVLGVSNWGWMPARDAIIGEFAPADREGRTFGYLHTVSHLFGAVAPVAIGVGAERIGFRRSFLALVAVMLVAVAAIASLYSRRVYRREAPRASTQSAEPERGE
ncbi:MAG: MFS transporter [Haloferacaceae archaeon]